MSTNRRPDPAAPDRYHAEWGRDDEGPFLSLRHTVQGYTFVLRAAAG
jgi:hypothetical protein